jgi:hypothetical protein
MKLLLIVALVALLIALVAAATRRSGPRITTITRDRENETKDRDDA